MNDSAFWVTVTSHVLQTVVVISLRICESCNILPSFETFTAVMFQVTVF